jgi:penicillin-binding protein 2
LIAGNTPSFELVVIPNELPELQEEFDSRLAQISQLAGANLDEMRQIIEPLDRKSPNPVTLVQNLEKDSALVLISRKKEFAGFSVQNNPIRDYKDPLMFSHLVGYTGKITSQELEQHKDKDYLLNDYIGKTGVEFQYEQYLRGVPGSNQTEIDAQGEYSKTLPSIPAQTGNSLKLNIDYGLQKAAYDAALSVVSKNKSRKAAVVVSNPQNGQVLAYLSLPGFDGNWFARGIKGNEYASLLEDPAVPLLNRVISGTYPPGSTVKPMLGIAALTEKIVTPQTKITDDGVIRIGSYTYYGYERSGLGVMDIYSAIARSSDIYFYSIGGGNAKSVVTEGLGPDRLAEWFRKFNLGSPTGIDLPNEKPGLVPDPAWKMQARNEPWYLGNTYHYSIGQGDLLTTPLQIHNATATIANGGKIYQPYIVDEVIGTNGDLLKKFQPTLLKDNFLDPQHVKVVQDAMRQTVTAGSARSLAALPLAVAGKTGTAQFDARDLSLTHAWFTSYAPFDHPQIAVTVLVESGGEGSSVAVPIAREIYSWWAANRSN